MATRIPRHVVEALRLFPGQFPHSLAEPSNWVHLIRAIMGDEETISGARVAVGGVAQSIRQFKLSGDHLYTFPSGSRLKVSGSPANDGIYTVQLASLSAGSTFVTVAEAIPSPAAGGNAEPIVTRGAQDVEEQLFVLLTARSLDAAHGAQLDGIGAVLGLLRGSLDDEAYRAMLRVQTGIHSASGAPEEIITVTKALSGVTKVQLNDLQPATIELYLHGSPAPPASLAVQLRALAGAGIALYPMSSASTNPFVFGDDVDAAGVPSGLGDDPDGSGFGEAFVLAGVVPGAGGAGAFQVAGDVSALFPVSSTFQVVGPDVPLGSTFTVAAVSFAAGVTTINVTGTIGGGVTVANQLVYGGADAGELVDVF